MPRRHITIVLELDEAGNPLDINRAWSEDEVQLPTGGLGMTPRVNVDEASLIGLIPDLAGVTAQLAATITARDEALTERDMARDALAKTERDREESVAAAESERDIWRDKAAAAEAALKEVEGGGKIKQTRMSDIWKRASEEEGEKIDAYFCSLTVRQRNRLASMTALVHAEPIYADVMGAFTSMFGADRAAALLEPSVRGA